MLISNDLGNSKTIGIRFAFMNAMSNRILPLGWLFLVMTVAAHAIPSVPVAVDDYFYTDTGKVLTVLAGDGVLKNDLPNTGVFVVELSFSGLEGTVTAFDNSTGAFTYDPGLFQGLTRFKYRIIEISTGMKSNMANVSLQVPDGGITLILLGLGLGGLALLRRKLA